MKEPWALLEDGCPNKKKKKNKMSSDAESIPDPTIKSSSRIL